ncbi:hypothetical protein AGMMS50289_26750 [Betaproteobacteria bacterium]|nr:hypothetical protein AGMMS50289_26750 [Betaproteobacteria bacterium]
MAACNNANDAHVNKDAEALAEQKVAEICTEAEANYLANKKLGKDAAAGAIRDANPACFAKYSESENRQIIGELEKIISKNKKKIESMGSLELVTDEGTDSEYKETVFIEYDMIAPSNIVVRIPKNIRLHGTRAFDICKTGALYDLEHDNFFEKSANETGLSSSIYGFGYPQEIERDNQGVDDKTYCMVYVSAGNMFDPYWMAYTVIKEY